MNWQPIETAPRDDKTRMLLCGRGRVVIGCLSPMFEPWATHWMPLPAPPDSDSEFKSAEPCHWGMIEVAA